MLILCILLFIVVVIILDVVYEKIILPKYYNKLIN